MFDSLSLESLLKIPDLERISITTLLEGLDFILSQRKQLLRSWLPTSSAFGVIPAHRQATLGTSPALFFVFNPFLNAHLTNFFKVWQVFFTMEIASHINQIRNAIAW